MKGLWPLGVQSLSLDALQCATEDRDEMGELCEQLSAFHISMRMARVAKKECHPTMFIMDGKRGPGKHVAEAKERQAAERDAKKENEPIEQKAQEMVGVLPQYCGGLCSPDPGCRPCWEPPIFDYSRYDGILAAEKELTVREGRKEGEYRMYCIDEFMGRNLLTLYFGWDQDMEIDAKHRVMACNGGKRMRRGAWGNEVEFWSELMFEVSDHRMKMKEENGSPEERHGFDIRPGKIVMERVLEVARELDHHFGARLRQSLI